MSAEPGDSGTPARHRRPRRRHTDKLTMRDLVYVAGLLLVAASLWIGVRSDHRSERADHHAAIADSDALRAIGQVQQGRSASITIFCAMLSSVSEAGRVVIEGSPKPPPPAEERGLEALGFPPFAARHAGQAAAGAAYVKAISTRVNRELAQINVKPVRGLVRRDGTIDCKVLQRIAAVPNPR